VTSADLEIDSRPPLLRARHAAEFLSMRALAAAMQCVDAEINLKTASLVGTIFAASGRRRVERAKDHLRSAMPDLDESEVERIAVESIRWMFRLFLVDALAMPRLVNPSNWHEHVELDEFHEGARLLLSDRPVILVTGHNGNWELLGFTLAAMGFPLTALARPVDNPLIYRWVLGLREARGMQVLTKWGATDRIVSLVESARPADRRVAFIADQNAGDGGLFVPWFGRMASSYKSIGLLAMKHDLPIVVGTARRLGSRFRYRIELVDHFGPADWADAPDPLFYITARYNRGLESIVRRTPEQYLWIHRRWKSRPKWERAGRTMPPAVRRNLESLPWMDSATLDRLVAADSAGAAEARV
jgi:KDO2-lipid IV(A) lauroyltransferase